MKIRHCWPLAIIVPLALAAAASLARAQTTWTLTTADFKSRPVALRAIETEGVRVVDGSNGERVVPMDAFLQLERGQGAGAAAAAASGRFMLHLVSGDRIGGEPVGMKGEQIVWRNPAAGELNIPLTQIAAITRAGKPSPNGRRTQDVVLLNNGDSVRGILSGVTDKSITVKPAGGGDAVDVPLDAVTSVGLAAAAGGPPRDARGFRVRLDDGSSVVGSGVTFDGSKFALTLAPDVTRELDPNRVVVVEQVNGPVSWLSSRTPAEAVYTPFVSSGADAEGGNAGAGAGRAMRTDADWAGEPFTVAGRTFTRGIGVHSHSLLAYSLDGKYKAFRTRYGINDKLPLADVTVRVKLDDKVVHEKSGVKAGELSPVVVVELGDAKRLTLEVDYGGRIDTQDRLNWLEPALLRDVPAPEPEPEIEAPPAMQPAATTMPSTVPTTVPMTRPS